MKPSATHRLCKQLHFKLTAIAEQLAQLPLTSREIEVLTVRLMSVQHKLVAIRGRLKVPGKGHSDAVS